MDRLTRYLLIAACIVIIIAGLHQIAFLINPIFFAMLVAFALVPFTHWLTRIGIPAILSVILTILLFFVAGGLVSLLVANSVTKLISDLPLYHEKLNTHYEGIKVLAQQYGLNISDMLSKSFMNPGKILEFSTSFFGKFLSLISNSFFAFIFVILFLIEFIILRKETAEKMAAKNMFLSRFLEFNKGVTKYVIITAITGVTNAVANMILLYFVGVDYLILWGVLTFLLSYIPTIGFILSMIPPAALALLVLGWKQALIVIAGYIIINAINENVVRPLFMKSGLKISFLVVTISFIFWLWCFGIMGGILAIPLTIAVKMIFVALAEDGKPVEIFTEPEVRKRGRKKGVGSKQSRKTTNL